VELEPRKALRADGAARPKPFPTERPVPREANLFAAELLIPEPAQKATWRGSIAACAERFRVSEEAIHLRRYNFRLVAAAPARR
jgi:Zn-dependent peptidase ImmA (M78 family)